MARVAWNWQQTDWDDERIKEDDDKDFRGTRVRLEYPTGDIIHGRVTMKARYQNDRVSMARISTAWSGDTWMNVQDAVLSIWVASERKDLILQILTSVENRLRGDGDPDAAFRISAYMRTLYGLPTLTAEEADELRGPTAQMMIWDIFVDGERVAGMSADTEAEAILIYTRVYKPTGAITAQRVNS